MVFTVSMNLGISGNDGVVQLDFMLCMYGWPLGATRGTCGLYRAAEGAKSKDKPHADVTGCSMSCYVHGTVAIISEQSIYSIPDPIASLLLLVYYYLSLLADHRSNPNNNFP